MAIPFVGEGIQLATTSICAALSGSGNICTTLGVVAHEFGEPVIEAFALSWGSNYMGETTHGWNNLYDFFADITPKALGSFAGAQIAERYIKDSHIVTIPCSIIGGIMVSYIVDIAGEWYNDKTDSSSEF